MRDFGGDIAMFNVLDIARRVAVAAAKPAASNSKPAAAAKPSKPSVPENQPAPTAPVAPGSSPVTSATSKAPLRPDSHRGRRDRKIAELKKDISQLQAKEAVTSAVSSIPLLGMVAAPAAKIVLGSSSTSKEIAKKKDELKTEQALNLLTDTVYALGAPPSLVNALDGGVQVKVVDDARLASDAAYDPKSNTIEVPKSMIEDTAKQLDKLEDQGIVTADGNVIDERRLNASTTADQVIKSATLVGAHEATHATQDANGTLAASDQLQSAIIADASAGARNLGGEDRAAVIEFAEQKAELARIKIEEVPAYQAQELRDMQLGASVRVLVTVDRAGKPLPLDQAAANVAALQSGTPLPYGESKGWVRVSDELLIDAHRAVPGIKRPGIKRPGIKRPGHTI